MPHDAKGRELKPGDRVMVPFTVLTIQQTEDFCNLTLETLATMPPANTVKPVFSALNTKMVLRANPRDSLKFTVTVDGAATKLS